MQHTKAKDDIITSGALLIWYTPLTMLSFAPRWRYSFPQRVKPHFSLQLVPWASNKDTSLSVLRRCHHLLFDPHSLQKSGCGMHPSNFQHPSNFLTDIFHHLVNPTKGGKRQLEEYPPESCNYPDSTPSISCDDGNPQADWLWVESLPRPSIVRTWRKGKARPATLHIHGDHAHPYKVYHCGLSLQA